MSTTDIETHATNLRAHLAERLLRGGAIGSGLHRAFATVPRHRFVPTVYQPCNGNGGSPKTERLDAGDPLPWLHAVYSDRALPIQPAGGHASTAPSMLGHMLQGLAPMPGDRVLEIGTCTGYGTAILAALLTTSTTANDKTSVTSIEIDPDRAEHARERLAGTGLLATVAVHDGTKGYEDRAPYDRILSTCAVDHIPAAWLGQLRPGGRILTPIAGGLAQITGHGNNTAHGRFAPAPARFMTIQNGGTVSAGLLRTARAAHNADPHDTRTPTLNPAVYDHEPASFLLRLAVPGLARAHRDGTLLLWHADGSWARITPETAEQAGPRRLWDRIENAHATWESHGRPGRERFGITITPGRQYIWLDHQNSSTTWDITTP